MTRVDDNGPDSERDPNDLDDVADREELRQRYYGLLQELRVVLPGVQVLMAFLLTVPFAQRFDELDDLGRTAYLVALSTSLGSIILLLAPTVFHRVADRTARAARLAWGIRLTVAGILLLAVSLISAMWCIVRFVFGTPEATAVAGAGLLAFAAVWIALPLTAGRPRR